MKLCLIMIGRFKHKNGYYYGDKKNINAIRRYLKYFDKIHVVAREISNKEPLYPLEKIDCEGGRISFHLYKDLYNIFAIRHYLSDFKAKISEYICKSDLVLCWAEPKSNIIIKTAHKLGKPCMIYVGGCNKDILLSNKSIIKKLAGIWVYYSNKKAILNADYVHYVTNSELQKRYPTKGKYIGASYVDIITDVSEDVKYNRFNRYKNGLDKITLGIIGYLNAVKGIDTAILAFSKLDSKFNLKILGGGDFLKYKELAKRLGVEDRVFFEGTLPTGEPVLNWLDSIDIYLQPSRTEGLPRATIEAMSRGCPVISSNVMGLRELVEEKWMHRPGDWKTMAKLILQISNDSKELCKQAKRSFEIARRYNRELLNKRIDNFFDEIINKKVECKEGE